MSKLQDFKKKIEEITNDSEPEIATKELLFRKNVLLQNMVMYEDLRETLTNEIKSAKGEIREANKQDITAAMHTHERELHFKRKDTPAKPIAAPKISPIPNIITTLLTSGAFWKGFALLGGGGGLGALILKIFA